MTPLEAIRAVLAVARLPDGRPIPPHLSHALLVLATYWPNIYPSQDRLARDMHTSRRTVNRRLADLEDAGLIVRLLRDDTSTLYRLKLSAIRRCIRVDT